MELKNNNNNKFISYLIFLIAFFILVFFTRVYFSQMQVNLDDASTSKSDLQAADQELQKLDTLKNNFDSNQDELSQKVSKYTVDFDSDKLFDYIYSYVNKVNSWWRDNIEMKGLTYTPWEPGDLWFLEWSLTLSARFSSQRALLAFLDYLIDPESEYTFVIDSFSYPNFWKSGPFQVTIPLKMYYKN